MRTEDSSEPTAERWKISSIRQMRSVDIDIDDIVVL